MLLSEVDKRSLKIIKPNILEKIILEDGVCGVIVVVVFRAGSLIQINTNNKGNKTTKSTHTSRLRVGIAENTNEAEHGLDYITNISVGNNICGDDICRPRFKWCKRP